MTGAIILSTMGSVCMVVAASAAGSARWPVTLGAMMVWLTLMAAVQHLRKATPPPIPAAERQRVGRLVAYASAGEGVAIFLGINVVIHLGHAEWVDPLIVAVVGLHFVPLAKWLPRPAYYITAIALLTAAALGLSITEPALRRVVVFGACAGILWATSALVLLRANSQA